MANKSIFTNEKPVIGMVHLLPLPGTPGFRGDLDEIFRQAEWEANILDKAGLDGLIVENFGDIPYFAGEPDPQQLAIMAIISSRIKKNVSMPVGINIQFNAWRAETAVAYASQADFMRVEVFVDTVVSAQGLLPPCAAKITRFRKELGAENVLIFADIQTKYTTNLIQQSIEQSALDAQEAGADALIVTGSGTGKETPLALVENVKKVTNLPVFVGSGTNKKNLDQVLAKADGVIVGSALKEGGNASNKVSAQEASAFMSIVKSIRR